MMGGGGAAETMARRALVSRRVWSSMRAPMLSVVFHSSFVCSATRSM